MVMRLNRLTTWPLVALVALVGTACSNSSGLELRGGVQVWFATRGAGPGPSAPALSRMAAVDDTVTSGADTIIITSVELVVREIELEPAEVVDCDADPEPPGCQDVELGPVLVSLPLTPGAQQAFAVEAEPGTYQEIELEIHKLSSSDPADAVLRQQNPDMVEKSIRVRGTYNRVAFVFRTDVNEELELEFDPPLVLQESGTLRVTIFVDAGSWFVAQDGSLLDPANDQNKSAIDNNIQQSFEAFEDDDGDGNPDS